MNWKQIPLGIKLISVLTFGISLLSLIGGIIYLYLGLISISLNKIIVWSILNIIVIIIVSGGIFLIGRGLLKGYNSFRQFMIIVSGFMVFLFLITLNDGDYKAGVILLVSGLLMGSYLLLDKSVKDFFHS